MVIDVPLTPTHPPTHTHAHVYLQKTDGDVMEKVVQSGAVEDSMVAKIMLQPASLRLDKHKKQLQLK